MIKTLFLAMFLGVTVTVQALAQGLFEHPLIGKKAPDFTLSSVKGATVSFEKAVAGRPAMVFFWATWCPHCREQLKELAKERTQIEAAGVSLFLIDIGEPAGAVTKFLSAKGYDLDVLLDSSSGIADKYQVYGVPTFFLIGADGLIKDVQNGFPEDYAKILKK